MTKRIGIIGADGYVGRRLMSYPNTIKILGDVSDHKAVQAEIKKKKPELVIHLAAKTDVDWCEKNQSQCDVTNLWGTANVADACEKVGIPCVILSTFHVFSGKKRFGNSYSEKDKPDPVNYYGATKFASEAASKAFDRTKVVRTSYLFDYGRLQNRIDELNEKPVPYPTFQFRSFLHLHHFCDSLMNIYVPNFEFMPDLLHLSGSETVSWYEFMSFVAGWTKTKYTPVPQKTEDSSFVARAHKGGLNSKLSYRLGFEKISFREGISLLRNRI